MAYEAGIYSMGVVVALILFDEGPEVRREKREWHGFFPTIGIYL